MIKSIIKTIEKSNIEINCAIVFLLSLLGWIISYNAFVTMALILTFILIYVKKEPIYFILGLLTIVFSYNVKYTLEFPVNIAIFSLLLSVYIAYIAFKNRKYITMDSTMLFLIITSILSILSLCWNNSILIEHPLLFFIVLSWPLYLVIYITFKAIMKKNSIYLIITILKYLGLLIAMEVIYSALTGYKSNILMCEDNLGWGICNEAGIILCLLAPIAAYFFIKNEKNYQKLYNLFILFLMAFAIILTGSRGSYLFGAIEAIVIFIFLLINVKRKLLVFSIVLVGLFTTIIIVALTKNLHFKDFISNAFYNGFDDNGRFELWNIGLDIWNKNILTSLFGSGMVSYFNNGELIFYEPNVYLVYHSSFFQILVAFGSIGMFFGFLHLIHKYEMLLHIDKSLSSLILIGYIIVEVYGLIDNTYGMYYFMPLIFMLEAAMSANRNDRSYSLF